MNIQQCYTRKNMKREKEKKQTTSLCLSTYFNILIRVLLLIKTLILCFTLIDMEKKDRRHYGLHIMFYTHRNAKKRTDDFTSLVYVFFFKGFLYSFL